ncbi:MAG: transporter substrate-binding domain-containing protein [Methylocystaceae bacterium]|nr:transporter substrate-binding domain-containing protein [Methylocystaceae bacterium]
MKKIIFICTLMFSYGDTSARAQTTIEIGANQWFPYVNYETEQTTGLAVQKIKLIFKEIGHPLRIKKLPFKRALLSAQNNLIDGILLANPTEERKNYLAFSKPIFCDRRSLYVRKGKYFDWHKKENLKGKILGRGIGFYSGPVVEKWVDDKLMRVLEVPTTERLMHLLIVDRIDVITFSDLEVDHILQKLKATDQVERLEPPLRHTPLSIGLVREHGGELMIQKINTAIDKLNLAENCK